MKIWYLPLEPYRERYTEQLLGWTQAALDRRRIPYTIVLGDRMQDATRIQVGPVLDARGRSHYALTQVARLLTFFNHIQPSDWIFIEDLFTPGFEALPYLFDQVGWRPRIATRNYAQSVDTDDFTFRMRRWMRPYEEMVARYVDVIFVASTVHKEMWEGANLPGRVEVVGLPFDSSQVMRQGPSVVREWAHRPRRVVYSSRLDTEKQPHFFMDVVAICKSMNRTTETDIEFVVCSGSDALRSNDPSVLSRMREYVRRGLIDVRTGLTKSTYYAILADARVQLNTARQDFISFTAIEASTFGVPTLAPAYRSFPEALENRHTQLYAPWSETECAGKLKMLLSSGEPQCKKLVVSQDGTLDRMIDVFQELIV